MAAQTKRVVVNGTTYQVKCSYNQQKEYQRQAVELKAASDEGEDIAETLRERMEHAIPECVMGVEDQEGTATEITAENFADEIDGEDMQYLFLYLSGQSPRGVDVIGAVPFVSSKTPASDS